MNNCNNCRDYSSCCESSASNYVRSVQVGLHPVRLTCPHCCKSIQTFVVSTPSVLTHATAFIMCFFCFIPCSLLPYLCGSCNYADHYCPNCRQYVGSYGYTC